MDTSSPPTHAAAIHPAKADSFERARRKFLRKFPHGFRDETYLAWERDYKWGAHQEWTEFLSEDRFRRLLRDGAYREVATKAVKIESGRSLLFSFEKMALRDAVRSEAGAKRFAEACLPFCTAGSSLSSALTTGSWPSRACPASRRGF